MTDQITPFDLDTIVFQVPITLKNTKNPLNLTNATVSAIAGKAGAVSVLGSVVILNPPTDGKISVVFDAGVLGTENWTIQVIVTLNGVRQTVREILVKMRKSHRVTP